MKFVHRFTHMTEALMFYVWLVLLLAVVALGVLIWIVRSSSRRRTSPPGLDEYLREDIEKRHEV